MTSVASAVYGYTADLVVDGLRDVTWLSEGTDSLWVMDATIVSGQTQIDDWSALLERRDIDLIVLEFNTGASVRITGAHALLRLRHEVKRLADWPES